MDQGEQNEVLFLHNKKDMGTDSGDGKVWFLSDWIWLNAEMERKKILYSELPLNYLPPVFLKKE